MLTKGFSDLISKNAARQSQVLILDSKLATTATDGVVFKEFGNKCSILLNRPKALNSLNLPMIRRIYPQLQQWETDGKDLILIEGAGEKAFCAGADVQAVADSSLKRDVDALSRDLFYDGYMLCYKIAQLKIPYIALTHGITMGGGVGLSVHGQFRVATEKTIFAMPETAIGFFPDVGCTFVLPRMEGYLGIFLALTGCRLKGYDVVHAGIATHFCPINTVSKLHASIMNLNEPNCDDVDTLLKKYAPEKVPEFSLRKTMDQINMHFRLNTIEEIIDSLEKDGSTWAKETKQTLLRLSPTSLKITMEAMKRGKVLNLDECFKMEFRLSQHCMIGNDFYEGVRALLIDKDQSPKWKPTTLSEVSDDLVKSYFEPVPGVADLEVSKMC